MVVVAQRINDVVNFTANRGDKVQGTRSLSAAYLPCPDARDWNVLNGVKDSATGDSSVRSVLSTPAQVLPTTVSTPFQFCQPQQHRPIL